jgi:diadenylate cyclase
MATDPKETTTERKSEHRLGDLGFTRIPEEDPRRKNPELLEAIAKVAPGTGLREAVDDVIRSHEGALLVVGDPNELSFLYSGGIRLDAPFRPQLLYELAKMDGAIIVDEAIKRLAWANVQLMPDPTIPSNETGTRHRTAERVAKQTGALVVSVSQQRETVTIFVGPARYQLDPVADVQNAVVLDDVLVVLQRAEMTSRMAQRLTRDCVELGSEGRMIRLQLEELVGDVPRERDAIVRDYTVLGAGDEATDALAELAALSYQELLEFGRLAEALGYDRGVNPLDQAVVARGYRTLTHIPRLPEPLVRRVVSDLGSLEALVRASQRELESVEGVGTVRAREIREGLRRLQEHNLVDRYLQL